jgi:hypothetical protein
MNQDYTNQLLSGLYISSPAFSHPSSPAPAHTHHAMLCTHQKPSPWRSLKIRRSERPKIAKYKSRRLKWCLHKKENIHQWAYQYPNHRKETKARMKEISLTSIRSEPVDRVNQSAECKKQAVIVNAQCLGQQHTCGPLLTTSSVA